MASQEPKSPTSSATATPIATPSPIPPPVPVETHPNRIRPPSSSNQAQVPDPSRLAPEDAYKAVSPPRLRPLTALDGSAAASAAAAALRPAVASLRAPPAIPPVAARLEQERRARAASRRRRKPHVWKKLLWIKQPGYPDNYTDPETFLEHLQRNPNSRQYDFWPLVADSMVIVQHVCSMAIFVSAYAGIYQGRLSPVAVVACGTIATVVGWVMWDQWKREEEAQDHNMALTASPVPDDAKSNTSSNESAIPITPNGYASAHTNGHANGALKRGLGLSLSTSNLAAKNAENNLTARHGQTLSKSSFQSMSPIEPLSEELASTPGPFSNSLHRTISRRSQTSNTYIPQSPTTLPPSVSHRNQARLKTAKSALLIYFALLGLSPILKSLTKSTSSDSIWALATWLLIINIFFFDYGSQYVPFRVSPSSNDPPAASTIPTVNGHASVSRPGLGPIVAEPNVINGSALNPAKSAPTTTAATAVPAIRPPPFPSSLSTNAAVMASTVLASRLPTTTSVFSLTLFSIQVFGLFPIFRRHLRHHSYTIHIGLSLALVLMASAGLGLILSQSYTHTYGDCGYCLAWIVHVALRSMIGIFVGCSATIFVTGGCAWWLINLQRYKNVVTGPWDPARPILAGGHGRARGATD